MKTRGFKKVKRQIQKIEKKVQKETSEAAEDAMSETTELAQSNLVMGQNVWRGKLLSSLKTVSHPTEDGFRSKTVADSPYAAVVEFGSGQRFNTDPYSKPKNVPVLKAPRLSKGLVGAMYHWSTTKSPFYQFTNLPPYALARAIAQTVGHGSYKDLDGKGMGTNSHPYMRPSYLTKWGGFGQSSGVRQIRRAYRRAVQL